MSGSPMVIYFVTAHSAVMALTTEATVAEKEKKSIGKGDIAIYCQRIGKGDIAIY
jgi:hypothetical protein